VRAIAPDWPIGAHRLPFGTDADLSPRGIAGLVAELCERLGLEDVTLVGNDSGGVVCQYVAALHPQRVGRLVLTNCDGPGAFPPRAFKAFIVAGRRRATLLPVLRAVDSRLREAAAVLGAGPGRVFWAVDLPVLGRSLGLSVGFALAVSLGEFGATSFLARPERPTLPVAIARLIGRPGAENLGMALAASTVLAVATTLVIAVAERVRMSSPGTDL